MSIDSKLLISTYEKQVNTSLSLSDCSQNVTLDSLSGADDGEIYLEIHLAITFYEPTKHFGIHCFRCCEATPTRSKSSHNLFSYHHTQLHRSTDPGDPTDYSPHPRLFPSRHQLHGGSSLRGDHHLCEQLPASLLAKLAVATRSHLYIPELDQLHPIPQ